jgi:hypothetical protein
MRRTSAPATSDGRGTTATGAWPCPGASMAPAASRSSATAIRAGRAPGIDFMNIRFGRTLFRQIFALRYKLI